MEDVLAESGRSILIVDDEANIRHMLELLLRQEQFDVQSAADGVTALGLVKSHRFDFILSDVKMPKMDGLEFLRKLKEFPGAPTCIMMSAFGTSDSAIEAMKLGAYDYIFKPFKPDEVVLTLHKAMEREALKNEVVSLRSQLQGERRLGNLIGDSLPMKRLYDLIQKISAYKTTVLILGESGVGKEVIDSTLHQLSDRASGPFIAINCAAIPENLLESELFGHTKGAFTGAATSKPGLFEVASHGTIFLDEIGELPASLQAKLLRVLQEEEIRRVGDTKSIQVDVRVVAATVRDLEGDVKSGAFREDLYYRLNVISLKVPPLRDRRTDIPMLVEHFIGQNRERLNKDVRGLSREALHYLMGRPWRGNVRELQNVIERAMVLASGDKIDLTDVRTEINEPMGASVSSEIVPDDLSIKRAVRTLEQTYIRRALELTHGNRTHASKMLEISHRALLYKMKDYGIE